MPYRRPALEVSSRAGTRAASAWPSERFAGSTSPRDEGYGAGGFPAWGIPPNGGLLFEIEVRPLQLLCQ